MASLLGSIGMPRIASQGAPKKSEKTDVSGRPKVNGSDFLKAHGYSHICEVPECEREAEYNCNHPAFFIKDRSPSDKTDTVFCEEHADEAVNVSAATGMPINITELRR